MRDPAEATVIAGSKIDALLYGDAVFDEFTAQAEAAASAAIPSVMLQQLRHHDWQQRHRAVNSLAGVPAAAALPNLLEATADEDRRVQMAAYEILAQFEGEAAAQKALIWRLCHIPIAGSRRRSQNCCAAMRWWNQMRSMAYWKATTQPL